MGSNGKGSDGLPTRLPNGRLRNTRPGDVAKALTSRWEEHGLRLFDLLGNIAEGRYIPRRDMRTGELRPGEEDQSDPTRYPSVELQARTLVLLIERMVGKVPDMVVTADVSEGPRFDLSKVKTREDLKFLRRVLQEAAPTRAEQEAAEGDSGP